MGLMGSFHVSPVMAEASCCFLAMLHVHRFCKRLCTLKDLCATLKEAPMPMLQDPDKFWGTWLCGAGLGTQA